jgi:hypothetical protein
MHGETVKIQITVFSVMTVFWFTFMWTFGRMVPPHFDLMNWVQVEGEVSNFFRSILDPFLQL